MKRILTLLLLVFTLKANAQLLTFSSEVGYFNNDENITAIKQVWEGYVNAVAKGATQRRFGYKTVKIFSLTHIKTGFLTPIISANSPMISMRLTR